MFDPHLQNHLGYVASSMQHGSYFAIFLLSMIVSYIFPLPEVVLLILIGFLAKNPIFNVWLVLVISILGTIAGDNILFRLSLMGSKHVEHFNRKMRAHKLIKYEHLVADNIGKTIYFLRFVTGVRFFGPLISGTLGAKKREFFYYNASATILHSTLFIMLGYLYRHKIFVLIAEVEVIRNILLFSSVLIVGVLIRIFSKKTK